MRGTRECVAPPRSPPLPLPALFLIHLMYNCRLEPIHQRWWTCTESEIKPAVEGSTAGKNRVFFSRIIFELWNYLEYFNGAEFIYAILLFFFIFFGNFIFLFFYFLKPATNHSKIILRSF